MCNVIKPPFGMVDMVKKTQILLSFDRMIINQVLGSFFFVYFIWSRILRVAYLKVANLVRHGGTVYCSVSDRPQYSVTSCPFVVLQVMTQSTHLLKDCYPSCYQTHTVPKF